MKETESHEIITAVMQHNFRVKHHRNRNGCDFCKKDEATEFFIGLNGNCLWVCSTCMENVKNGK